MSNKSVDSNKSTKGIKDRESLKYEPSVIEKKWQKAWEKKKVFSPNLKEPFDSAQGKAKPYYNLMMFPYPSAEGLHAGNMYAFTGADIWGRYQRMQGRDVFEPIGLDGFGIHSENYAIKIGKHPVEVSKETEKRFYSQLRATGNTYDWNHTLETYDPSYYRWTQWLFIQMFKAGLAYRKKAQVNWCPSCKTVLADEQVVGGNCERCGAIVEARDLEQWFFKITDYAERLLSGLETIDWTEKVKIAQRNWIGKKEGIEIAYDVLGPVVPSSRSTSSVDGLPAGIHRDSLQSRHPKLTIKVFTTRPDTNFGATFIVLAPEHPLTLEITTSEYKKEVEEYIKVSKSKSREDRIAESKGKTGAFTGSYAINNLNGEKMPIWVSDFVLMDFGTGAVVGVPGHDIRDFEFAKKFDLPIKRVVVGSDGDISEITEESQVQEEEGKMVNSQFLDGLDIHEATTKVMDYLEEKGWGKRVTTYHLRDWLISRQRYWGPPIPMIYCEKCAREGKSWFDTDEASLAFDGNEARIGDEKRKSPHDTSLETERRLSNSGMRGWYPVPEDELPVELPFVENFKPTGTGEAPLAQDKDFVKVRCPHCGVQARRETDVSDTFLDSAWYYLRYLVTDWDDVPFPSAKFSDNQMSEGQVAESQISDDLKSGNPKSDNLVSRSRWLPVSMYIGGAEHSVLHLMYVRFVTMVLKDLGYLDFEEPFPRFYAHGLLIKEGHKMSKSKGNVIVPDSYIQKYGADTLRCYLMFLAPFNQGGDFRDSGIEGMYRFLNRVWRLVQESKQYIVNSSQGEQEKRIINKAIKRVSEDLENLRYNRALAGIMEYVNELEHRTQDREHRGISNEDIEVLLKLLAPFAPHMTEELWEQIQLAGLGSRFSVDGQSVVGQSVTDKPKIGKLETENRNQKTENWSIHLSSWPEYNPALLVEERIQIPVQVNGKLRGLVIVARDSDSQEVEKAARENETVSKYLIGESKKVIFVPGKLINFVV